VIRLAAPPDLSPHERYGLETLVDLSRLLVVADPEADVVELRVADTPSITFDQLLSRGLTLERCDGIVTIGRAALSHVTGLAGAALERQSDATDRHDRVPSSSNALVTRRMERDVPVQRWADELASMVGEVAGRRPVRSLSPWPAGHRWAAAVTHDLDVVAGWPLFTLSRSAELLRAREWHRCGAVAAAAAGAVGHGPVDRGVRDLLDAEREVGVRGTWFMICGTPTPRTWWRGDITYRLESRQGRRLIELVRSGGHEIGLHGSFRTACDGARMQEERRRLSRMIGAPPAGVRQHFLRLRPGETHALMEAAGFMYDATLGFSDRNGFRTGTADVVPALGSTTRSALDTVPLVWMDRALSKYQHIEDPEAWVDDGLELAEISRAVGGLWVGLWHPNLVPALGFPDTPAALRRLLTTLAGWHPWFATLQEIVQWRRARRSTRATRVTAGGAVEVVTDTPAPWPVTLEDGKGRR
jgi:hypothetical protein